MPITKIQKKDLLQWQIWLDSQPIATQTKNYMISSIRGTYRFANAFYGIPDISMVLKRFKKKQEEKKEMQTWTPAEFEQFIAPEENPYYICYFNFLYWTGARRSEALGLRKQDFNGNKVHIWHSMKNFKDGFLPLKNSASERTIVMDDKLTELMQQCLERCTDDSPFVFGGETTLPIRSIQNHFEANIKKSGVKKIRLHDLRHSHASLLINNNVNVLAVSRRLGHATIQQTLETYAHLFASTEDQMMETLDKLHNS
jgi:integrase